MKKTFLCIALLTAAVISCDIVSAQKPMSPEKQQNAIFSLDRQRQDDIAKLHRTAQAKADNDIAASKRTMQANIDKYTAQQQEKQHQTETKINNSTQDNIRNGEAKIDSQYRQKRAKIGDSVAAPEVAPALTPAVVAPELPPIAAPIPAVPVQ